jgi:hypothetical protein
LGTDLPNVKKHPAMLLRIQVKYQPTAIHKSIILTLEFPDNVDCNTNICSKPSTSASPDSELLHERGNSISTRALLVELSPVRTIKTVAYIRVRNK